MTNPAQPAIRNNIFSDLPYGILLHPGRDSDPEAQFQSAAPIEKNIYWNITQPVVRQVAKGQLKSETGEPNDAQFAEIEPDAESHILNPEFEALDENNYSLAPKSPAIETGIGAVDPLALQSPWPIQPLEIAIFPEQSKLPATSLWSEFPLIEGKRRPRPERPPYTGRLGTGHPRERERMKNLAP